MAEPAGPARPVYSGAAALATVLADLLGAPPEESTLPRANPFRPPGSRS